MDSKYPAHSNIPFTGKNHSSFFLDFYLRNRTLNFFDQVLHVKPTGTNLQMEPYMPELSDTDTFWRVTNVMDFTEVELAQPSGWKYKSIPQYKGYGIDLKPYSSLDGFLEDQLKRSNRKKLRANFRKLEEQGTITYEFYRGEIDPTEYSNLFELFYKMLEDRFHEKKMYNRNLIHWPFFYKDTITQLKNKSACLFAIKDNGKPIAISLNYLKKDLMFSFIQAFDSHYRRFSLGNICTLKKLEWCFEQNIGFYDMAMGETYNKRIWSNYTYGFTHFLFYRTNTPRTLFKVWVNTKIMIFRQWLRDKGILGKWFQFDKFFYKWQARKLQDFDWKSEIEIGQVKDQV